jgi:hypothetical protein
MKLDSYFIHPVAVAILCPTGGRWQVTLPASSGAASIFYRLAK